MRTFDEIDYLVRYPDVRANVRPGPFGSGEDHYVRHGRAEGRVGKYSRFTPRFWSRVRRIGPLIRVVKPCRDYWSGMNLSVWCWRPGARGYLSVSVVRVSRAGLRVVRRKLIPLHAIDDQYPLVVYWSPIEGSSRYRFLVVIQQLRPSRFPLVPAPLIIASSDGDAALTYSEPEAALPFPDDLLISPATQCNLNCVHCISRHTRRGLSVLDDATWRDIVAAAGSGQLKDVRTDYSGDIFFSDRRHGGWLDRVIALDVPFGIDTHANDISADSVDRLMRSRLHFINFSLDTMDPDDYPRIRKGARPLAEVLGNVRTFMASRNARRPDITTVLSFVLMRRNVESLGAAIDLAAELKITAVAANHLHAYTRDMADESLMLEPRRYERVHTMLTARAEEKGVQLWIARPIRSSTPQRGHMPCDYPWHGLVVLGSGDVMACCVPGTKVGNVRDGTLAEIWRGPELREFRVRINSDNPPDACSVCPMLRLENNFASYVPGLSEQDRRDFERRCVDAALRGD
jgi:radical SAM protein with 4Fe4S-binding SPASM domain